MKLKRMSWITKGYGVYRGYLIYHRPKSVCLCKIEWTDIQKWVGTVSLEGLESERFILGIEIEKAKKLMEKKLYEVLMTFFTLK